MTKFIILSIIWTLCAALFCISYWNYVRYVEAKRDPGEKERFLRMALYASRDAGIGECDFQKISGTHYLPYQRRFKLALAVGLVLGIADVALLFL